MNYTIAIIATLAALVSSVTAYMSWRYNRELSLPAPSLTEVKVSANRLSRDKLDINFIFVFKNVGRETLKISEFRLAHFDDSDKKLNQVGGDVILNPLHTEAVFSYLVKLTKTIDPQVSDEAVQQLLPGIVGKHFFILKMIYKGKSIFSKKEMTTRYFLEYKGGGAVHQISAESYRQIEQILPEDLKVEEE